MLSTSIENLRPVHEKFKRICEKVLSECDTDVGPLKMQIAAIEASWNNMVQHYEIKLQQATVVEKPSCSFFDKETAFSEWLTEAEARLESLDEVPSTLRRANEQAKQVEVRLMLL